MPAAPLFMCPLCFFLDITRWWVHCVVGIAMQCPETFGRYRWLLPVRVVEFWAAGQDAPKGNPDGSIVLAVHLAVRSV